MRDMGFEPNDKRNTETVGKETTSKDNRGGKKLKMDVQEEQTKRSMSTTKNQRQTR